MTLSLLIRADATSRMGTGHLMRCIALAQYWKGQGGTVTFLSHCNSKALQKRIFDEGFEFIPVEKPHPDPSDIYCTLERSRQLKAQNQKTKIWIVLDGYHFTPDYQKAIRENGYKLLVIDDIANQSFYNADIILNQNVYANDLKYDCNINTVMLMGPDYALLRKEFTEKKSFQRNIVQTAKRILITMGGADRDNVSNKIIDALMMMGKKDIEVKIIAGPANPHKKKLKDTLHNAPFNAQIVSNPPDLSEYMLWADLAITSGGSTCLELALLGVPFVIIVIADNQFPGSYGFMKENTAISLGWHKELTVGKISKVIRDCLYNRKQRETFSARCQKLVDGLSGRRIIEAMMPEKIRFRKATEKDMDIVWSWANDPVTRAASFFSNKISYQTHKKWFIKRIHDDLCIFYIAANNDNIPIGQVRFDINGKTACISISLAPAYRGLGFGSRIIRLGTTECLKNKVVNKIVAFIKADNHVSLKAFQKAGYNMVGKETKNGMAAIKMAINAEIAKK